MEEGIGKTLPMVFWANPPAAPAPGANLSSSTPAVTLPPSRPSSPTLAHGASLPAASDPTRSSAGGWEAARGSRGLYLACGGRAVGAGAAGAGAGCSSWAGGDGPGRRGRRGAAPLLTTQLPSPPAPAGPPASRRPAPPTRGTSSLLRDPILLPPPRSPDLQGSGLCHFPRIPALLIFPLR